MSYDVGPDGEPIIESGTAAAFPRRRPLIQTGAKPPRSKKRSPYSAYNRESQTLKRLEEQERLALRDIAFGKSKKWPDDDARIERAIKFLEDLAKWRSQIRTGPFRDARPKKKQREAAYTEVPTPYEGAK